MRYSILHISDLHRIKEENIDCILSSFAIEKDYYVRNGIPPAKLIVVSGDIVNGSNNEDSMLAKNEIQEQYRVASKFLKGLCELFIGKSEEDLLHVIIVPGNHDMSRYYSKLSMEQIPSNDINALVNTLWEENNNIRWSWKDLKFYKIAKEEFYNKRFDDFIEFYNNFYSGKRIWFIRQIV
jgi:DNA polymerase II small subunit/DNA polymerase delta subunit B